MAVPCCRIGDADVTHCSQPFRAEGSDNVFCNGRAWSREGDVNTTHKKPSGKDCDNHNAPIGEGSYLVYVNGIPSGRIGDDVASCTQVAEGSPDVFAGQ